MPKAKATGTKSQLSNLIYGLTPRLTGAGARSAEGTNTGHENAEGMASVGVRVEPTVRLVAGVWPYEFAAVPLAFR